MAGEGKPIYRGHIAELDGLRGFGVLAVVIGHTFPAALSTTLSQVTQLAWICMDWFFVMSGFLIAGILLDSKERPDFFQNFFTRRALRILPLYYLVIGALTIALYASGQEMSGWASPWWYFFYLGNVPTALQGEWARELGNSFVPMWSLQIEEQFYLLFPLLVRFLSMATLKYVLIALVAISVVLRTILYFTWPENRDIQYVFLPCRLDGLAFGALIAIRYRSGPWLQDKRKLTLKLVGWMSATLLMAWFDGFDSESRVVFTVGFLISSIAAAYLILWLIEHRNSAITAGLRTKPALYLGSISYAIYLLHMPVAYVLIVLLAPHLGAPGDTSVGGLLLVAPVTVALAALSWKYFEGPILKLKDRVGNAQGAGVARKEAAHLPPARRKSARV